MQERISAAYQREDALRIETPALSLVKNAGGNLTTIVSETFKEVPKMPKMHEQQPYKSCCCLKKCWEKAEVKLTKQFEFYKFVQHQQCCIHLSTSLDQGCCMRPEGGECLSTVLLHIFAARLAGHKA